MTDIVDFSCPVTYDDNFFALISKDGIVKTFNFTIIDSPFAHSKYIKDIGFGKATIKSKKKNADFQEETLTQEEINYKNNRI